MAKIKFTKTELKRQRDALKQFTRYLPTLQLKKQQLQVEVQRAGDEVRQILKKRDQFMDSVTQWIEIFNRPDFETAEKLISVGHIETSLKNIAGIDVPVLDRIDFVVEPYDLFASDAWLDSALATVKQRFQLELEEKILREQQRLLELELRTTTQRVNLFEKVKIPEAKENIRVIQIALGDEQTAAVCRSKIAKRKAVAVAEVQS